MRTTTIITMSESGKKQILLLISIHVAKLFRKSEFSQVDHVEGDEQKRERSLDVRLRKGKRCDVATQWEA